MPGTIAPIAMSASSFCERAVEPLECEDDGDDDEQRRRHRRVLRVGRKPCHSISAETRRMSEVREAREDLLESHVNVPRRAAGCAGTAHPRRRRRSRAPLAPASSPSISARGARHLPAFGFHEELGLRRAGADHRHAHAAPITSSRNASVKPMSANFVAQ